MGNTKATSPLKIKDKRTKKSTGGKEGDHRHRMTEQEEDEELLSDLNQAKKIAVSFDESPAYIKVGTYLTYIVVVSSIADPDLNPACHFDADPDPTFYFDAGAYRILASK